jgi:hypothetical protein
MTAFVISKVMKIILAINDSAPGTMTARRHQLNVMKSLALKIGI